MCPLILFQTKPHFSRWIAHSVAPQALRSSNILWSVIKGSVITVNKIHCDCVIHALSSILLDPTLVVWRAHWLPQGFRSLSTLLLRMQQGGEIICCLRAASYCMTIFEYITLGTHYRVTGLGKGHRSDVGLVNAFKDHLSKKMNW